MENIHIPDVSPALTEHGTDEISLYNTPGETARICRKYNLGISESSIRCLCRNGEIPCIKIGRKTLINWNVFYAYLQSGGKARQAPTETPCAAIGILPLPSRIRR